LREIAAAGLVLFRRGDGPHLYLTLRNARHGDVGLPKGHLDPGEAVLEGALRETEEETGIRPLPPNRWFRRELTYPVAKGVKRVTYLAAESPSEEVTLSREHDAYAWEDLDGTLALLRHENLRAVVRDAATFLKDPILRRGLAPAAAKALLVARVGAEARVVAHTREVSSIARAIGGARGDVDADYVEAAAWLHDIGRAVAHDERHPLEGFRIVVKAGHPGYAPPCLSHYTKGAAPEDARLGDLAREMREACDLETFHGPERVIALADALAAGPRRVTLEERYEDLARRYGPSPFLDRNLAICRGLKEEFEEMAGRDLYEVAGIPSR
jgi:putative nucleotidyltransferase with HDIG domain